MRTIIMISKTKAADLAVIFNAYQNALTEFCDNQCDDTASSLRVWGNMLDALQDELQIHLTEKRILTSALDAANKFSQ